MGSWAHRTTTLINLGDAEVHMAESAKIVAEGARKVFPSAGEAVVAIDELSLTVPEGEFLSIVGPSGCGKTTFLRALAGLERLSSGRLEIAQADPTRPLNSVVFQEYGIFPWKTVRQNVAFGLQMRGIGRRERDERARQWIERVGLRDFTDAYPHELSGGMKQRVSIARALANDPEVLLMDEPLGALDAQTRAVMQEEFLHLWEWDQKTVVYITHSIDEAVFLSDRVVVMTAHPGRSKAIHDIDLPRPRSWDQTGSTQFSELRLRIWEDLQDEVKRTMGVQADTAEQP